MPSLKIVLGVSGGISVYKAVELLRIFKEHRHDVYVVMTEHATHFVTPLTFQILSGNPVRCDLFSPHDESKISHIELAQNADAIVVAPASANIIAKSSHGLCDDLLSTIVCASTVPVIFSPAMNTAMWENPMVQKNIDRLKTPRICFIEPESGYLACDTVGTGRLPNPRTIYDFVLRTISGNRALSGKRILITAGPTIEPIDKFRFISNYSTGKMGYALANRARLMGAEVTLISGPASIKAPSVATFIPVNTAGEMYDAVMRHFRTADIVIKAAAVSDYRPAHYTDGKIKKDKEKAVIELIRNKDILQELGGKKQKHQYIVGFAAEADNPVENGKGKRQSKNVDLMIANQIGLEGAGFAGDSNKITMIGKGKETYFSGTKDDLAGIILDRIAMDINVGTVD